MDEKQSDEILVTAEKANSILVIEDNEELLHLMTKLLRHEYNVFTAENGKEGIAVLENEDIDLIVSDVMMPEMDGLEACMKIREFSNVPIIMLTAKSEDADKLMGFECGADDYLTKPFHLDELAARIRSLTLRRFTQTDVVLTCAELSFDTKTRKASVRGEVLSLTRKETGILEYLLLHQGRPVSQEELLEHVWDSGADGFGNSIRVHISALRKKLRAALGYDPIRNRIGEGYVMEEQT